MNKNKLFYIPQSMIQASDIKYFISNESRILAETKKEIISINVDNILSVMSYRAVGDHKRGYR